MTPTAVTTVEPATIDPLAPAPRGTWFGQGVSVSRRIGPHHAHTDTSWVCTPRFCARRRGGLLSVVHNLTPDELNDELTTLLVGEFADTTVLRGRSDFEMVFTGVVRSTVDGGLPAWLRFYRNSMAMLEGGNTAFAPIHERAAGLITGPTLVDLGSCFGFFPLRAAAHGIDVVATDLSEPTMRLLAAVSDRMCRPLRTLSCDATRVPLPDGVATTVTALHLVEHLTPAQTDAVIEEALRLARCRVVIAVPFEEEPTACYGHVQRFDLDTLRGVGERIKRAHPSVRVSVQEFHGGWLVLDR
ncbi:MAG: methyltransferase domain-containing protein [Actinobacteria bacterium]|nr:methyltransferase domain-containing protein [Actinomycetota bacterium]